MQRFDHCCAGDWPPPRLNNEQLLEEYFFHCSLPPKPIVSLSCASQICRIIATEQTSVPIFMTSVDVQCRRTHPGNQAWWINSPNHYRQVVSFANWDAVSAHNVELFGEKSDFSLFFIEGSGRGRIRHPCLQRLWWGRREQCAIFLFQKNRGLAIFWRWLNNNSFFPVYDDEPTAKYLHCLTERVAEDVSDLYCGIAISFPAAVGRLCPFRVIPANRRS